MAKLRIDAIRELEAGIDTNESKSTLKTPSVCWRPKNRVLGCRDQNFHPDFLSAF